MNTPSESGRHCLREEDFAAFFGVRPEELPASCCEIIRSRDFSYRRLNPGLREKTILQVLKRIDSSGLTVAGEESKGRWDKGWRENLQEFTASGFDEKTLLPKFIRPYAILRLLGDYAKPTDPNFELNFYAVLREWLFERYLTDSEPVYEFGCGTAFNLVALAKKYPKKELHGLDWVEPPKEIISLLAEKRGYNMQGHVFDMFSPDRRLELPSGSGVFMVGALEQLGPNFQPFLGYLLAQRPKIVVQVNHFTELYDTDDLLDYLALRFEKKRKYLEGYLPALESLSRQGKVEILSVRRVRFGSLYHDGYSFVVWRPL